MAELQNTHACRVDVRVPGKRGDQESPRELHRKGRS